MIFRKYLAFLLFIFATPVWANPGAFDGLAVLFLLALVFLALVFLSIIGLVFAVKQKPKSSFSFLMLPPVIVALALFYSAYSCCGHMDGPGTVRDIFMFLTIPGLFLVLAVAYTYYIRKKKYIKTNQQSTSAGMR